MPCLTFMTKFTFEHGQPFDMSKSVGQATTLTPLWGLCRVAVLDGGLPLWIQEGYDMDSSSVADADDDAPLRAAQNPPAEAKYQAHLQVMYQSLTSCSGCIRLDSKIVAGCLFVLAAYLYAS